MNWFSPISILEALDHLLKLLLVLAGISFAVVHFRSEQGL